MSQNIYADPIGKAFNKLYDGVLDIFAPLGENEVRNIDLWLNKHPKMNIITILIRVKQIILANVKIRFF